MSTLRHSRYRGSCIAAVMVTVLGAAACSGSDHEGGAAATSNVGLASSTNSVVASSSTTTLEETAADFPVIQTDGVGFGQVGHQGWPGFGNAATTDIEYVAKVIGESYKSTAEAHCKNQIYQIYIWADGLELWALDGKTSGLHGVGAAPVGLFELQLGSGLERSNQVLTVFSDRWYLGEWTIEPTQTTTLRGQLASPLRPSRVLHADRTPTPPVTEACRPATIASPRSLIALGKMNVGLTELISA